MHRIIVVLAAIMIMCGSIVASEAEEKQNPGGTGSGGVPGQPTTTAPKKPTTTTPKQPTINAPTQPPVLAPKSVVCTPPPPPPPAKCPSNAASCMTIDQTQCCTAPAGNQVCKSVQVVTSTPASCAAGYFGSICEPCPGGAATPCSSHGTCAGGLIGSGLCTCFTGYTGAACETTTPN
jgi:hypothetical protein